jgi:hypothetical protein
MTSADPASGVGRMSAPDSSSSVLGVLMGTSL